MCGGVQKNIQLGDFSKNGKNECFTGHRAHNFFRSPSSPLTVLLLLLQFLIVLLGAEEQGSSISICDPAIENANFFGHSLLPQWNTSYIEADIRF